MSALKRNLNLNTFLSSLAVGLIIFGLDRGSNAMKAINTMQEQIKEQSFRVRDHEMRIRTLESDEARHQMGMK